jgi:hypothetical protein
MGFPVPGRQWATIALYEPLQDMLASQEMNESGFYNAEVIRKDLESHVSGAEDLSSSLFNIAQFQTWSNLNQSIATYNLN